VRYCVPRLGVRDVPDLKNAFRRACAFVGDQIIAGGGNDPDGSSIWIQEDLHSPPRLRLPHFVPLGSIDRQAPAVPRADDLLSRRLLDRVVFSRTETMAGTRINVFNDQSFIRTVPFPNDQVGGTREGERLPFGFKPSRQAPGSCGPDGKSSCAFCHEEMGAVFRHSTPGGWLDEWRRRAESVELPQPHGAVLP